jgi:hypothetical protein
LRPFFQEIGAKRAENEDITPKMRPFFQILTTSHKMAEIEALYSVLPQNCWTRNAGLAFAEKKRILLVRTALIPILKGEFYGTGENNNSRPDHHSP